LKIKKKIYLYSFQILIFNQHAHKVAPGTLGPRPSLLCHCCCVKQISSRKHKRQTACFVA